MIQLRQVSKYVYDVFPATGFDNWTRVRQYHWGLSVIGGVRVARSALKVIQRCIEQHPRGSVDPINTEAVCAAN